MIDEQFLKSAVTLRRNYLKLVNNMDFYQKKAQEVISRLESTIEKINSITEEAKESSKQKGANPQLIIENFMKVLTDIEEEGKRIEDLISPMNGEIEKLALEEAELYRRIKERHADLTEEQIVKSVRDRLIKENLS